MIKIYYFDIQKHLDLLNSGSFFVCAVNIRKVNKILRNEKKKERIVSELVKKYVFENLLGKKYPNDIFVGEFGKPYLKDNSFEFNFTGNSEYIFLSICKNASIGIDVEKMRKFPGMAVKGFFSDEEWECLIKDSSEFTRIWTRKEAFLKCIGVGWQEKNECSVLNDYIQQNDNNYRLLDIKFNEDTLISICHEETGYKETYQFKEITKHDIEAVKK